MLSPRCGSLAVRRVRRRLALQRHARVNASPSTPAIAKALPVRAAMRLPARRRSSGRAARSSGLPVRQVLADHVGAPELQRLPRSRSIKQAGGVVDLAVDQHDARIAGVAQRARRLQRREGADLREDVGRGVEQHPVGARRRETAIDDCVRGLARMRALAHAGAVAAVAVPLREAAARRGAQHLDAHQSAFVWPHNDESPAWGLSLAAHRSLAVVDVHRHFEAETHLGEFRLGPHAVDTSFPLRPDSDRPAARRPPANRPIGANDFP